MDKFEVNKWFNTGVIIFLKQQKKENLWGVIMSYNAESLNNATGVFVLPNPKRQEFEKEKDKNLFVLVAYDDILKIESQKK